MAEREFSADEAAVLAPFVTNLDGPIFGLRNLPEVVKGALFSRYSRSDKDLRRILLDEFIQAPEADFGRIVNGQDARDQLVAVKQAEAFYDRVLVGYGDDSVAELGGAHIACEQISNIAAKALEDSRIGIDPLEKSTRYVAFNKRDAQGRYRYYREPQIMQSRCAERYEAALDRLFQTYDELLPPTLAWVRAQTARDTHTSERAYNSATRAKALDLLRGLLPMATLTNVGLFGNGRAFEYLLIKLSASPLAELQQLAARLQDELDQLIPSFVKRPKTARGDAYRHYLAQTRAMLAAQVHVQTSGLRKHPAPSVWMADYDRDAEIKLAAAIMYPYTDLPLEQVQNLARAMSTAERVELIRTAVGERQNRFHRPSRAFEEVFYTFDFLADIGAYRDLQRHRMLTQERQRYSVIHGYSTPPELQAAGVADAFEAALEHAASVALAVEDELPEAAQYVVPFAFRIRWRMKLNLREAYHLLELRSSPQGHPSYRTIAQEMFRQIKAVHPALAEGIQFVDLNDYPLERLAAEQRLDQKLRDLGGTAL